MKSTAKQSDETNETDERSIKAKIRDFSDLLETIDGLASENKKKLLWKEIYENAITDRQNAWMMFDELVNIVKGKTTEHAVHGRSLASYLERMNKANDQLIKLADLVAKAEDVDHGGDSPDELYSKIGRSGGT